MRKHQLLRREVKVLLVLKKAQPDEFRVMVRLHTKWLQKKVEALLSKAKTREAFDLIVSYAEVDRYVPRGTMLFEEPHIILAEDIF